MFNEKIISQNQQKLIPEKIAVFFRGFSILFVANTTSRHLNYTNLLDHNLELFGCQRVSTPCKKLIQGPEANTLNLREQGLRG